METRHYRIAGLRYCVRSDSEQMHRPDGILSAFRTEEEDWDVECTLDVVDALSSPEGELCFRDRENRVYALPEGMERYIGRVEDSLSGAYMRIVRKGSRHRVQIKKTSVPAGITAKVIENSMEVIHHLTAAGGFLLHASWIQVAGKAILFTGPSGVGKSTQAALWQKHRGARLINGDRAAVFPMGDEVQVRGIPYCGSSGVAENCTMPVAAVVHLEQAKTTSITRLNGIKAFRPLWQECCINIWNPEDLELGTQSVADMISNVPVFHLACTPDLSAVLALEKEGVI